MLATQGDAVKTAFQGDDRQWCADCPWGVGHRKQRFIHIQVVMVEDIEPSSFGPVKSVNRTKEGLVRGAPFLHYLRDQPEAVKQGMLSERSRGERQRQY